MQSELPKPVPYRKRKSGAAVRLNFWGVRGSIPSPGPDTVKFGGNTTCVELRADGQHIILDAGTGLRLLGLQLMKEFADRPLDLTLLLTHTHWDHIQGFPFFAPAFAPGSSSGGDPNSTNDIARRQLTNLLTAPYTTYALLAKRTVGDQPGRGLVDGHLEVDGVGAGDGLRLGPDTRRQHVDERLVGVRLGVDVVRRVGGEGRGERGRAESQRLGHVESR